MTPIGRCKHCRGTVSIAGVGTGYDHAGDRCTVVTLRFDCGGDAAGERCPERVGVEVPTADRAVACEVVARIVRGVEGNGLA